MIQRKRRRERRTRRYSCGEIIEGIKRTVDIVEVISKYTSITQKNGKYLGICPFTPLKENALLIDRVRGLYKCLECGAAGDIFTLVMEKEDLSYPETVKYLLNKYDITFQLKKYHYERILHWRLLRLRAIRDRLIKKTCRRISVLLGKKSE